jgi:hypothetical protein
MRAEKGNHMTTTRGITFGLGAALIAFASASCGEVTTTPGETQVAAALTSSSPGGAKAVCGNWHFVGRPFRPDCSGVPDGGLCQCGPWRPPGIDNFEDGDVVFGPQNTGVWFLFTDGTGTQTPATPEGLVVPSSLRGNRFAARSTGEGFTVFGAGFGSTLGCAYEVGQYDGFRFKVKAGGQRRFDVEVPTLPLLPVEFGGRCTVGCNDFHLAAIALADDAWYECTVPFAGLTQAGFGTPMPFDASVVTGISDAPYDLTVDDLEFVRKIKGGTQCTLVRNERHSCGD